MTPKRGLQEILNLAPPCSAVQNDALKVKPLRETPHPALPQVGEGVFEDSLPCSGRVRVGSGCFFVIPGSDPESHNWTNCKGLNNFKTLSISQGTPCQARSDDFLFFVTLNFTKRTAATM